PHKSGAVKTWSLEFRVSRFFPGSPSVPPRIAFPRARSHCVAAVLKTTVEQGFPYPYEEFAGHMKAMETVRNWEHTSRFGHVGKDQTSRANNARVVEYFFDSYVDKSEAVHKAEVLLSIYDYIGRNVEIF